MLGFIDQYSNSGGGSVNLSTCTGGVGGVDWGELESPQQHSVSSVLLIDDIALTVVAVLSKRCARSGGVSLYERGHCESERLLLICRTLDCVVELARELRKGRLAKRRRSAVSAVYRER